VQVTRSGVEDDGEEIAADSARLGLHDAHDGVGRNGRVDGVPAGLQDLHAGRGGKGLTRCDNPLGGHDAGTAWNDAHGGMLQVPGELGHG
jgi:hypothetical protein